MVVQTHKPRPAPDSEIDAGVIKDARARQRRHRRAGGVVIVAAIATGALILAFDGGGRSSLAPRGGSHGGSGPGAARTESPGAVFVQDPYMGVACHLPNSITCDRVGLAVWLRRSATVTATIAGEPVALNDPTWSYVTHSRGRPLYVYAGFLQPAGLTTRLGVVPESRWTNSWLGANAPSPLVRFRIEYGRGSLVTTQERVYLSAGWG